MQYSADPSKSTVSGALPTLSVGVLPSAGTGPHGGPLRSINGGVGAWSKSKSLTRSPSPGASSRTSGRGVRPAIRGRVEAGPVHEIILDELGVSVEARVAGGLCTPSWRRG